MQRVCYRGRQSPLRTVTVPPQVRPARHTLFAHVPGPAVVRPLTADRAVSQATAAVAGHTDQPQNTATVSDLPVQIVQPHHPPTASVRRRTQYDGSAQCAASLG